MEPSLYEQRAKKPVSQHSASPAFNRNTENRQAIFLGFVSILFFFSIPKKDYGLLFLRQIINHEGSYGAW